MITKKVAVRVPSFWYDFVPALGAVFLVMLFFVRPDWALVVVALALSASAVPLLK